MKEITVCDIIVVLKAQMKVDDAFGRQHCEQHKEYDTKLELIRCGYKYAITELEKHPQLRELYDKLLSSDGPPMSAGTSTESGTDARIKYGDLLIFLLGKLSKAVAEEASKSERKDICELSLGHHKLVSQALVHIKFLSVLPYIPEGIDRVNEVPKQWWTAEESQSIVQDRNFQAKQLKAYLTAVLDLVEVSSQVRGTVCQDIHTLMMAAETVNHLGNTQLFKRYRKFLKSVCAIGVLHNATTLIRGQAEKTNTQWLNKSMIGLVNEMVAVGHLGDLLEMYTRRGALSDTVSTSSLPFLKDLAAALCAGTPHGMSKEVYYECLNFQFFKWLARTNDNKKVGVCLFNFFIDALDKHHNYFVKSIIFNSFFEPLEKLNKCELEDDLTVLPKCMHTLANLFRLSSYRSKAIVGSQQMKDLFFLFCSFAYELTEKLKTVKEDTEPHVELTIFRSDTLKIINSYVDTIPNQEMFMLWAIREPSVLRKVEILTKRNFVTNKITVEGHTFVESPYGRYYPVASKTSDYTESADTLRKFIFSFMNVQDTEKKAEFVFSCLMEVFKAYINEDGHYNRLSDISDPKEAHDRRCQYIGLLVYVANLLCSVIFSNLNMADPFIFSNIKVDTTLAKLLKLSIISMTAVVKNLTTEVAKQKKQATLDVRAAQSDKEKELETDMNRFLFDTAIYGVKFTLFLPLMQSVAEDKMKGLDTQVNEMVRLTVQVKKLLGELKQLPTGAHKHLRDVVFKTPELNEILRDLMGMQRNTTNEKNDDSFIDVEELEELLEGMVHEKGQALVTLSRLLMKRNTRLMDIYRDKFHQTVLDLISDGDSYVYLAAINTAAEAAQAMTDMIIPFVKMFGHIVSVKEKKNKRGEVVSSENIDEKCFVRCRIALVICKVFDSLGGAAALYASESIDSVMSCVNDPHPDVRASAFAVVEHLFKTLASSYSIGSQFLPVFLAIQYTLVHEKDQQVRRNAIKILPMILKGAGRDMLATLSDHLLGINRLLTSVIQTDKDTVMVLHAQMAKEEMAEAMKENIMVEMNERARKIKI